MLVSCTYFTLVTPFRFAGFYIGHPMVIWVLDALDTMGALVMLLDLMVDTVQNRFRVSRDRFIDQGSSESESDSSLSPKKKRRRSSIKSVAKATHKMVNRQRRQLIKSLAYYRMDRWVPWPSLDVRVLLSFILQGCVVRSSLCAQIGLHWSQLFGLLRVSCVARVLHFLQCAENNYLLQRKLDAEKQLQWRIVKLLIRLAFITHVCACMYCAVARLELGYEATDFPATSFFPDPHVLYGPGRLVFNCYSRALHWAFVSLSGIGNNESVPATTLECWFTLIVHMIGAVFYAIVTGTVINVLEEASAKDNKMGEDMVKLSKFLTTARMSSKSQERIMKGYVMRNVLTTGGSTESETGVEGLLAGHDDILGTLPNYLRMEVGIYARAELIHRREALFLHCSNAFLVALSSNLSRTRTLLSGDYLMQKGQVVESEFAVIDSGTLQVRRHGHTIKTLGRGHCVGKAWLLQMLQRHHSQIGDVETSIFGDDTALSENTDWLLPDGTAGVSIRALGPVVLMTGLQSLSEVHQLEEIYQVDFQLMRAEIRGENTDESERRAKAIRGIAKAVRRFKARKTMTARKL